MKKVLSIGLLSALLSSAVVAMEKSRPAEESIVRDGLENLLAAATLEEEAGVSGHKRKQEEEKQDDFEVLKKRAIENPQLRRVLLGSVGKDDRDLKVLIREVGDILEVSPVDQGIRSIIIEVVLEELMQEGDDTRVWETFISEKLENTALHCAALRGHVGALECLLKRGAQQEARTNNGATALHYAAFNGHVGALELLLRRGAHLEAKTDDGLTALHWAAVGGHVGALKCLLGREADLEAKDAREWTALHWAAVGGHVGALKCLLERGAQLEAKTNGGWTAEALSSSKGYVEGVDLLRGITLARKWLAEVNGIDLQVLKFALAYMQKKSQ